MDSYGNIPMRIISIINNVTNPTTKPIANDFLSKNTINVILID